MAQKISRRQLDRYAVDHDLELVFFEPPAIFDRAIVGLVYGFGQEPAVLYDEALVLAALAKDSGLAEEAQEWFDYNTLGTWVGPHTPRFLVKP